MQVSIPMIAGLRSGSGPGLWWAMESKERKEGMEGKEGGGRTGSIAAFSKRGDVQLYMLHLSTNTHMFPQLLIPYYTYFFEGR